MSIILQSYAKLNLTLRITSKRPDTGYHDLFSLFYKIPSGENVILETDNNLTHDEIFTNMTLTGENTILKALRLARESCSEIPYMRVKLFKTIPPGSGLGAGSGNAAVVINYLSAQYGINKFEFANRTGADVTFFSSGFKCACVSGIGDVMKNISIPEIHGVILIPSWPAETQNAYKQVDEIFKNKYPLNENSAHDELDGLIKKFQARENINLLPNDFNAILFPAHNEYQKIFAALKNLGSYAFGVTGSGSAAFGLFFEPVKIKLPDCVRDVLYF